MSTPLAEIKGFAPAGMVGRLKKIRWQRPEIVEPEGGKIFMGISLAGRHLTKDGGSEDLPLRVVVTDESTKERFEVQGRTFLHVPKLMQEEGGREHSWILKHSLQEQPQDGLVEYTLQLFPLDWVD